MCIRDSFKSETERTEEAFPKIRFIIAPAAPEPALMHDPAYKGLVAAVTTPSPGHGNVLGLANACLLYTSPPAVHAVRTG